MTRIEVLRSLPDTIDVPGHGYAELEVTMDTDSQKGVCYRHKKLTASYGTYRKTWKEIYQDLGKTLVNDGYEVQGLS